MMYITDLTQKETGALKTIEWHIGGPVPSLRGRVVQFQADGDELAIILLALNKTRKLVEGEEIERRR